MFLQYFHNLYYESFFFQKKKTVLALLLYEDKVILQLRDNNPKICSPDMWAFFGGSRNKFESSLQALNRELKEEINLNKFHTKVDQNPIFTIKHCDLKKKVVLFEEVYIVRIINIDNLNLLNKKPNEGVDTGIFEIKTVLNEKNLFSKRTKKEQKIHPSVIFCTKLYQNIFQ